jgi:hypothetical protein
MGRRESDDLPGRIGRPRSGRELEAKPTPKAFTTDTVETFEEYGIMNLNIRKPLITTAIAGGIVAVSATAAFAFWTATGTGSGTATTADSSTDLTITQNAFNGSALVPGGAAQAVSGTIANANTFAVPITSFVASVAVDSTHAQAGCSAAWYSVPTLTPPASVPAGGSANFSGTVKLNDTVGTNQDACKGATVTLTYTAS